MFRGNNGTKAIVIDNADDNRSEMNKQGPTDYDDGKHRTRTAASRPSAPPMDWRASTILGIVKYGTIFYVGYRAVDMLLSFYSTDSTFQSFTKIITYMMCAAIVVSILAIPYVALKWFVAWANNKGIQEMPGGGLIHTNYIADGYRDPVNAGFVGRLTDQHYGVQFEGMRNSLYRNVGYWSPTNTKSVQSTGAPQPSDNDTYDDSLGAKVPSLLEILNGEMQPEFSFDDEDGNNGLQGNNDDVTGR